MMMANEKWERTKERFTDWFDYNYDRTVRRSPDARSAYEERVQTREKYWAEQHEMKARRRLEERDKKEKEIQQFLDDKLPLLPDSLDPEKFTPVHVYRPTGLPPSYIGGGGGGGHDGSHHFPPFERVSSLRFRDVRAEILITSPSPGTARRHPPQFYDRSRRAYFVRPSRPGRRAAPAVAAALARYRCTRLYPLSEQDEEAEKGGGPMPVVSVVVVAAAATAAADGAAESRTGEEDSGSGLGLEEAENTAFASWVAQGKLGTEVRVIAEDTAPYGFPTTESESELEGESSGAHQDVTDTREPAVDGEDGFTHEMKMDSSRPP